jgi:hypothetical protein
LVKPAVRFGAVEVTADGEGLVSHAGVALLVELADRVGVTAALSETLAGTRERRSAHDPGRVLRDAAVMLADGGDCVTDVDAYRGQERLFGAKASETTTHRVLKSIDEGLLGRVRASRAQARARVWDAGAAGWQTPSGRRHAPAQADLAPELSRLSKRSPSSRRLDRPRGENSARR